MQERSSYQFPETFHPNPGEILKYMISDAILDAKWLLRVHLEKEVLREREGQACDMHSSCILEMQEKMNVIMDDV